jgi:plasmid stability protein
MPALHIRNVDDAVVEELKHRAAEHHRSLEGELREILQQVAFPKLKRGKKSGGRKLRLKHASVGSSSAYGRDEIYAGEEG